MGSRNEFSEQNAIQFPMAGVEIFSASFYLCCFLPYNVFRFNLVLLFQFSANGCRLQGLMNIFMKGGIPMSNYSLFSISNEADLRLQIHAKLDRCLAIERRVQVLRSAIPYMTDADLFAAGEELRELRNEMAQHQMYIAKAQEQLNKLHKPAMVID